jgi:small conductance mechanosensitive channel
MATNFTGAVSNFTGTVTVALADTTPRVIEQGSLVDRAIKYVTENSGRIVAGIIILIVGVVISRTVAKFMNRGLERRLLDPPLRMLLVRVARWGTLGIALVIALETWGIPMTALITGVGVAGVGIGIAVAGLLSNIFAGLTIIFTKPFQVGEYIAILNCNGVVESIELTTTTLLKPDTSHIVIPNHKIIGEILQNYGVIRQLNLSVGVGYSTDLNRAQALVREILESNKRVLKDPAPGLAVSSFGDSAINIAILPFTKLQDMGAAQTEINQAIIERFRAAQIEIPFPQREIRVLNSEANPLKV